MGTTQETGELEPQAELKKLRADLDGSNEANFTTVARAGWRALELLVEALAGNAGLRARLKRAEHDADMSWEAAWGMGWNAAARALVADFHQRAEDLDTSAAATIDSWLSADRKARAGGLRVEAERVRAFLKSAASEALDIDTLQARVQVLESEAWGAAVYFQAEREEVQRLTAVCYQHAEQAESAEREAERRLGEVNMVQGQLGMAQSSLARARDALSRATTREAELLSDLNEAHVSIQALAKEAEGAAAMETARDAERRRAEKAEALVKALEAERDEALVKALKVERDEALVKALESDRDAARLLAADAGACVRGLLTLLEDVEREMAGRGIRVALTRGPLLESVLARLPRAEGQTRELQS